LTDRKFDDDLITVKNTDDYNNYLKKEEENEDNFTKRNLMLSGNSRESAEAQKHFALDSSLKTVGYGSVSEVKKKLGYASVEKAEAKKLPIESVVMESKMGKDRLLSLYSNNSPS
jgi:hypothetical protein